MSDNSKLKLNPNEQEIFTKAIKAAYQAGRKDGEKFCNYTPQLAQGETATITDLVKKYIIVKTN